MRILYISLFAPYDKVAHAGGQTLNHYMKRMLEQPNTDVDLVTFCTKEEKDILLSEKKGLSVFPLTCLHLAERAGIVYNKLNPWNSKTDFSSYLTFRLLNILKKRASVVQYDVIFLEWTHIVLHVKEIRRIFPDAKIIASEPDVSFLGYGRKYLHTKNRIAREYNGICARNMRKRELDALQACDYIYVQNFKDRRLLEKHGISKDKVGIMTPFYHKLEGKRQKNESRKILFFGQMSRIENHEAAMWFIEQVMPQIRDLGCCFVVAGSGPREELLACEEEDVKVTGFVDDIAPLFYEADLFVCPLRLGAGIKVKVLEAMYTGIPVLTNQVGIEGIPAKRGRDFLFCETAEDYARVIREYYDHSEKTEEIGINGSRMVKEAYSIERSVNSYQNKLRDLVEIES